MEKGKRNLQFRLVLIYLGILLLGSFWLTLKMATEPVSMTIEPTVPRKGEPVLVTFKLTNSSSRYLPVNYQFYANGRLLSEGLAGISAFSCETYQYSYENPLRLGEQVVFMVRAQSELGNYERVVSLPCVPPQIWSSFVSFGSLSNALLSSATSMTYYYRVFGTDRGLNAGAIITLTLVALLMFMEVSQYLLRNRAIIVICGLRGRLSSVSWVLLIIAVGTVYTTIIAIVAH